MSEKSPRKRTEFVVLVQDTKTHGVWVEKPHLAVGTSARSALMRSLENGDLQVAGNGERVALVPRRSWRPVAVELEHVSRVVLKSDDPF